MANWPIQVGGVYRSATIPEITSLVTAIDGDDVYHDDFYNGELYRSGDVLETIVFRKVRTPQNESPIPELVGALEAMMSLFAPLNYEENEVFVRARQAIERARALGVSVA